MSKKLIKIINLNLIPGKVTPGPPVGPILGSFGLNLSLFCKEYNSLTKDSVYSIIPVKISVFNDKSYSFILKTPPVSVLILYELSLMKGSENSKKFKIGTLTEKQVLKIANQKLNDLNTQNIQKAINIITGTAINMGIIILNTIKNEYNNN
uniref:Ribosomal protein L11 n=1 Tax=Piridium sociabile TaxID=2570542 RepID=A0A5B9XW88_9ALVE|nr:ribosomal protein L11 [Piridium sociabile]